MARPREFDRDEALEKAMRLFWAQGYAATSTEELVSAMGIGRQSLYDTFGDKRQLYLEALRRYHAAKSEMPTLPEPGESVAGAIRQALLRVVEKPQAEREIGCMGINATSAFCGIEPEASALALKTAARVEHAFAALVELGMARGEFPATLDAEAAGRFLYVTLQGLTVRAQAGAAPDTLREAVDFTMGSLSR